MQRTQTQLYLFPAVYRGYGNSFYSLVSKLVRLKVLEAIFLDDPGYKGNSEYKIFAQLNNKDNLVDEYSDVLMKQRAVETIYPLNPERSHYMAVLKIPKQHRPAYDAFLQSKYSEMYKINFIKEYVSPTSDKYQVLCKTEKKRAELMKEYLLSEADAQKYLTEYDEAINFDKEVFDYERFESETGATV